MNQRNALLVVSAFAALAISVPAQPRYMPVESIRVGMVGTGITVFEGSKREEFKVHILGVLHNVQGPRRDLIVAKLEGGPLAHTGVIGGMSGSPVYIDGQLVGAVSYSLGAFSTEPIAGITPIAEMIETTAMDNRTRTRAQSLSPKIEGPLTQEAFTTMMRRSFARMLPFASRSSDVQALGIPSAAGAELATMLRPIATPMVLSGFEVDVRDSLVSSFRDAGFVPTVGAATRADDGIGSREPLQPGDPVGVSLMSGDMEMGATGTVTHIDGTKVYAFGHPFYNLGPTEFPMTRAHVYTVLPSLLSSSKISGIGEVIGTIRQDRSTAIAGILGNGPAMIPVRLTLDSDRGIHKVFNFKVVNDQMFTPLLTYVSILNSLRSYEREFGAATFSVKSKTLVKGHGAVDLEDVFTGDSPSVGAATSIAGPITFLLTNDVAPVEVEGVEVSITSTETPRTTTIERAWLDDIRPRAGRTVPLKILTRNYRGEETIRTLPIEIPSNATGTLTILVSDGAHLAQWEQRELRQTIETESVAQMIRTLNNTRRNSRIYVRLLSDDAGAVVNGETLPSLPPSVLAVYEAERNGGSFTALRSAAIGQWELPSDNAISGARVLTINIER